MSAPMPLLRATGLVKTFGAVRALDGADFELYPGEIHALVGDNGAGKSTLIKVLLRRPRPRRAGRSRSTVARCDLATPREAQEAGIETVYQDLALAGSLDAAENVFLGREVFRPGLAGRLRFVDRPEMRRRVSAELDVLGTHIPTPHQPGRDHVRRPAAGRGGRARGDLGPAGAHPRRAGRGARAAADGQRARAHGPGAPGARAGRDLHLAHAAARLRGRRPRVGHAARSPRALPAHRARPRRTGSSARWRASIWPPASCPNEHRAARTHRCAASSSARARSCCSCSPASASRSRC